MPDKKSTTPLEPSARDMAIDRPAMHVTERSDSARSSLYNRLLTGLLVLVLGFTGGWLGADANKTAPVSQNIVRQRTVLSDQATLVSTLAKEVGQSVVSVNVTGVSRSEDSYSRLFGYGAQQMQSAGTGIIISTDGLVLTNRHVVPIGTTDVSVTLSDGTVLDDVKVVGRTSERDSLDIAFLKIGDRKGHTLAPAAIGDSSKMKVGDSVIAIGNALGQFQNTVTTGIISGYGRSIQAGNGRAGTVENLDDLFQTDAAINEGNSGGPLINTSGEVIGVNTAIASGSQNIGFAIPMNDVKGLIDSVKRSGKLERPYIGVVYVMLTDDLSKEYGLPASRGAYVPRAEDVGYPTVIADGPAEKAGIKEGDIITKLNGTAIDEKTSLISQLSRQKVGDTVTLTVQRDGKAQDIQVELGLAPES